MESQPQNPEFRNNPENFQHACVPIKDLDKTRHLRSLIRVFDRHSMGSPGSNQSSGEKLRLFRLCRCAD